MTMTSVAVSPGSLGAPFNMITPKRYHLQQGMAPNSASPTPDKNYDTLSKGKKSWSVRLGLSRQSHSLEDPVKGWGTISGGSALSRQMIYGDPWLYGTVRGGRLGHDPRAFITPPPPPGAPILIVCSCPEFLSGTTRKLGNCRKCGGHRLAGIPFGGTCRIPSTPARTRPSLAGILRPPVDDPYDQMRRNRLIEPRSRARSISPHLQNGQRDTRSQSVIRAANIPTQDSSSSRVDWFNPELNFDKSDRQSANFSDDWSIPKTLQDHRTTPGRVVRIPKKPRLVRGDWQEVSSPRTPDAAQRKSIDENWKDPPASKITSPTSTSSTDSRKSILECNVNPYLLVKKRTKDEDDLSDDLSDNALEQDETPSSLFDSSKVKSIERIPNRSAVAAIGGQRIRVFNEPREISDEEDLPLTRIPIPKILPKRPPRRLKEAKTVLKSILKRGRCEGKRKNVLFNVDNVIFAPEKPPEVSSSRRTSRSSIGGKESEELDESIMLEVEKPKFITIPNIKDPVKHERPKVPEARILPRVKSLSPVEKIKIDKFVPSRKLEVPGNKKLKEAPDVKIETNKSLAVAGLIKIEQDCDCGEDKEKVQKNENLIKPEDFTELEIEIEELKDHLGEIAVDEKDLILKSEGNLKQSYLTRSQSERSTSRPEISAGNVSFVDTMRLSLCKRVKEPKTLSITTTSELLEEVKEEESAILIPPPTTKSQDQKSPLVAATKEIKEAINKSSLSYLSKEQQISSEFNLKNYDNPTENLEHFRRMRPTSWSPPPGKPKHLIRDRLASEPGTNDLEYRQRVFSKTRKNFKNSPFEDISTTLHQENVSTNGLAKIEIGAIEKNVCKITVSPRASPLVHRLQVGSGIPTGLRRTSILINGDQNSGGCESDNKVTISVGGEDSICNPTVISVNSDNSAKIQSFSENRTLVILENYKSNIVVESTPKENNSKKTNDGGLLCDKTEEISSKDEKVLETNRKSKSPKCNLESFNHEEETSRSESKARLRDLEESNRWSNLTKKTVISKLLEDSLRKARENGEILDESSGEAILKILKQSLLKSNEYESSDSTLEPETNYSRSSSSNSENDFISTNLFLEENPYEVIKEPIYEEIPDEPPPLPLSPPPTDDYLKERIYFKDEYKESYFKKANSGQFLGSYLSEDLFKKPTADEIETESYLSKSPEEFFKKTPAPPEQGNLSTKFELLNFLMNFNDHVTPMEEDEDVDEEEDAERDLEALYEQKETSLGDLSSKSSQISNVSDSSEECNIILTSSPETLKARTVDIERTDSGVGSESSQASSSRGVACRRWRTGNASSGPGSLIGSIPQIAVGDIKLCEDCDQRTDPLITDSGVVYAPFVCRKCSKKRAERKEIITEIVETEQKYGRDLQIILEEFHRPMLRAGLLTPEQLSAIFLNVEELLEHNVVLAEKLKDAVEFAQESGDEDLVTVDVGKIFLESERMLHAFENYCTRQGSASLLLQNLEKEKELLRIFLKVSQMENTVLRRMNLNSFLMVPVQRVTKYPLLLARLLKATPSIRPDAQEAKKRLKQSQTNIELHLEHMNAEAKDVTSTKLWRRISIIQNGRRYAGEQDMVNIKLRKMAVEVLEWAHEEARFVLEGRLLIAQPTDNNWRRGRTVKLAPVTAMLVTNGKSNTEFLDLSDDTLFPKQSGIKEATLLLVKEKIGRYSLLREPLYLDKCIVCCEADLEDYFEIQELSSKETFIFKAEDGAKTKRWCRTLQAHAQSLGAWRRRRGALPNIMICGVARS